MFQRYSQHKKKDIVENSLETFSHAVSVEENLGHLREHRSLLTFSGRT